MYKKIGLLCPNEEELAPFLERFDERRVTRKAMLTFREGTIEGAEVVAVVSGVCKVNAAVAAQLLIDCFAVDAILNSGTAGGLSSAMALLDVAVSDEIAHHDVAPGILTDGHPRMKTPFFPADPTLLSAAGRAAVSLPYTVHFGRMVTGEAFIEDDRRDAIIDAYHPLTVDMETAAVAHVCYVNGIPFLAVRAVTDTADHDADGSFHRNVGTASEIARDITVAVLREINKE